MNSVGESKPSKKLIGRNYSKYISRTISTKSNLNADRPDSKLLQPIKKFSTKTRFAFLISKRKTSSVKRSIIRYFFWERSKTSRYIVQGFLILLIVFLLTISVNGSPISANSSVNLDSNNINKTLSNTDDLSIATQSGETIIPGNRKVSTITNYTVQSGDTISSIADKFGISVDTVKIVNDIKSENLTVGSTLRILPVSGILHKVVDGDTLDSIASKYKLSDSGLSSQIIADWNNFDDVTLPVGSEIIVPGGKIDVPKPVVATAPAAPSIPYSPATNVVDTGNFVRPTRGGTVVISQCFKGYLHDGMDIAKVWSGATPTVVAARAGTITFSGWFGGWTIKIKHSNGFETVYYHMASPSPLKVGDQVNAGDPIGIMGTTGNSTGVHLHFIIEQNGVKINPLTQVDLRNPGDLVSC